MEILYFYDILFENNFVLYVSSVILNLPEKTPLLWNNIKFIFILSTFLANIIILNFLLEALFSKFSYENKCSKKVTFSDKLNLIIGQDFSLKEKVIIPEKGLFQNILITGAIGSGKTSSAMYPITEQLIAYNSNSSTNKLGMLILDVKGNYYNQVLEFAKSIID